MFYVCTHNSFLQRYEENLDNMLELLICEKRNFKSFIKVLKAYGLHQHRPSNTKRLKNSRLKNTSPSRSRRTNFVTYNN